MVNRLNECVVTRTLPFREQNCSTRDCGKQDQNASWIEQAPHPRSRLEVLALPVIGNTGESEAIGIGLDQPFDGPVKDWNLLFRGKQSCRRVL